MTSASLRPAPPGSGLGVSVHRGDGLVIVSLTGSFDIYSLPGLRDELVALAGTVPLVVDLSLKPLEIADAGRESAASGGIRRRTARVTPAVAPNPASRVRFRASAPRDTTDSG